MTTILFDLDGTIINSFLGITRCVQYALRSKGIEVENLEIGRASCRERV